MQLCVGPPPPLPPLPFTLSLSQSLSYIEQMDPEQGKATLIEFCSFSKHFFLPPLSPPKLWLDKKYFTITERYKECIRASYFAVGELFTVLELLCHYFPWLWLFLQFYNNHLLKVLFFFIPENVWIFFLFLFIHLFILTMHRLQRASYCFVLYFWHLSLVYPS